VATTAAWSESGSLRRLVGSSPIDDKGSTLRIVWTAGRLVGLTRRWLAKTWSISSPRPLKTRVTG
jgi:hypothetical protein